MSDRQTAGFVGRAEKKPQPIKIRMLGEMD